MEILKFEGGAPRGRAKSSSNKKTIRIAVALGAVALVGVLSSTLAANITINSNTSVEFGQGLTGAAACDSSLTITPTSTFVNGSGSAGTFYPYSIKVEDTASQIAACAGKYIRLAAYDSGTALTSPLTLGTSGGAGLTSLEIYIATSAANNISASYAVTTANASGLTPTRTLIPQISSTSTTAGSFTAIFANGAGVATAGQINKITVESHS